MLLLATFLTVHFGEWRSRWHGMPSNIQTGRPMFDELAKARPKNHFTIGIHDDVTHTSLAWDPAFTTEDPDTGRPSRSPRHRSSSAGTSGRVRWSVRGW